MKKFLIALSVILLLVIGYLLYTLQQTNDKLSMLPATCDEELSDLQSENQLLKDTLSGTVESLNSLQIEKSEIEENLSLCENRVETYVEYIKKLKEENNSNVGDNNTNTSNISNNNTSNSNTTIINGKENGRIQQVYTDKNGIKKIEIVYGGSMVGGDECGDPAAAVCFKADNPKVGTFIVSDNAQIIMQTLSHTKDGYFNNDQVITFDYFEEKFNDTNNYDEYPHNYSNHFKLQVYRITFENNIVVKIEEQYMP